MITKTSKVQTENNRIVSSTIEYRLLGILLYKIIYFNPPINSIGEWHY